MSQQPQSWGDIHACGCRACRALTQIHERCVELQEPLFVIDCRHFGHGYQVCDSELLFVRPAAAIDIDFETPSAAVQWTRRRQRHCDVFQSTFPVRPEGSADYEWAAVLND